MRGVWTSSLNTPLRGGVRPRESVTDEQKTQYGSINMIEEIAGKGVCPSSAKTLDQSLNDFRLISTRRFVNSVQLDVQSGLRGTSLEPNTQLTWSATKGAINEYLHKLWRLGASGGPKEEESYFVSIGSGLTMTEDDVRNGLMRVEVGIAAVRPSEFITLNISQQMVQ